MSNHKASNFYNDYLHCMNNLPMDVQRNASQMLEYNSKCLSTMSKIEALAGDSSNFEELKELLTSVKVLGDSKVQVARSTSTTVMNMVERLQNGKKSLKTFIDEKKSLNSKVKEKSGDPHKQRNVSSTVTALKESKSTKQSNDKDSNVKDNAKVAKKPRLNKTDADKTNTIIKSPLTVPSTQRCNIPFPRATATVQVKSQQVPLKKSAKKIKTKKKYKKKRKVISSSSSSDDEDIDPNEPTYCFCEEISYGDMICCDNDLCPIQWFHFKCLSLLTNPKGKWFCPKCRGDRPNTMKPKAQFLEELEKYNKEKENK